MLPVAFPIALIALTNSLVEAPMIVFPRLTLVFFVVSNSLLHMSPRNSA